MASATVDSECHHLKQAPDPRRKWGVVQKQSEDPTSKLLIEPGPNWFSYEAQTTARLIDTAERIIFRFCSRGNWSRYHRVRPALALLWSTLAVSVDPHSASLTSLSRYQYLHALTRSSFKQPMLITRFEWFREGFHGKCLNKTLK